MILNFGVVDIPYVDPPTVRKAPKNPARKRVRKARASYNRNVTTGDVAGWLENKYHVMEHFWELHGQEIANDITDSLAGSVETFLMGGPLSLDPTGGAMSKIEDRFKQMLSLKELDSLGYPGIPTAAALAGVSSRHKSGYTKNRTPRPSFIDTGLFQSSFHAWVED